MMKTHSYLTAAAVALACISATPALADKGGRHGNGHGNSHAAAGCPPGLAKKSPACVPPGQARDHDRYGRNVGDRLRWEDYPRITDLGRYRLEGRDGWRYYRDGDRVFRVDSDTRRILAVMELIDAFSN